MRWFVSFMTYVNPMTAFPSPVVFRGWEPGNAVIEEHPVEWARKTPAARLLFWSEMPDGPSPEDRLAIAFRMEAAVIAGLKSLKEAGIQVPWAAMCVAARAMAEKAVEVSKEPPSALDEEMRSRIDAHADELSRGAGPQLRALDEATRVTAEDLSARVTGPRECCDRYVDRKPCDCPDRPGRA